MQTVKLTEWKRYKVNEIIEYLEKSLQQTRGREFFRKQLLKSYTEETFIYKTINQVMREENWEELQKWKYYVYLMLKSFLNENRNSNCYQQNLTLYRGTKLPKK